MNLKSVVVATGRVIDADSEYKIDGAAVRIPDNHVWDDMMKNRCLIMELCPKSGRSQWTPVDVIGTLA